jgi:hypothetical protein
LNGKSACTLIDFSVVSTIVSFFFFLDDDMSFKYKLCACTLSTDRMIVSTDMAGGIGMKYPLYTYARKCTTMGRAIISINLADSTGMENTLDFTLVVASLWTARSSQYA